MNRDEYITDAQVVKRAKEAVRIEIEKQKALDNPIIVYDSKTKTVYKEYNNGIREEVGQSTRKGRYSEQIDN